MSWSKKVFVIKLIILALLIMVVGYAVAGEKQKIKGHTATINVKWEQIEAGDEEGHVIGISESKRIGFFETSDEKYVGRSVDTMDLNLKTGQGFGQGYLVSIDKDGDKRYSTWEGKSVTKDHWEGKWTIVKGTGKFEGIIGGGTFSSYTLAPGQSYSEWEGEIEIPTR